MERTVIALQDLFADEDQFAEVACGFQPFVTGLFFIERKLKGDIVAFKFQCEKIFPAVRLDGIWINRGFGETEHESARSPVRQV